MGFHFLKLSLDYIWLRIIQSKEGNIDGTGSNDEIY